MAEDGYVLRSADTTELQRLKLQHEVWSGMTDAVIARAGFGAGDQLADLGCGPGFLSFDLAAVVGPEGGVRALDNSPRFIDWLRAEAAARGLDNVHAELVDLRELEAASTPLDGALCRWVLMFLDEPERVIKRVAEALRPGGVFVAIEYTRFKSISLYPNGVHFRRFYDAVYGLIAGAGGDPDIGAKLPRMFGDAGLDIVDIVPFWEVGRPGTPLWDWLATNNVNHGYLVEQALLSADELERFFSEWAEASGDPDAFFTAPPILATIARRS